jgi:hypothetical protein
MEKSEYARIEKEAPPTDEEEDKEDRSSQPSHIIGIQYHTELSKHTGRLQTWCNQSYQ